MIKIEYTNHRKHKVYLKQSDFSVKVKGQYNRGGQIKKIIVTDGDTLASPEGLKWLTYKVIIES